MIPAIMSSDENDRENSPRSLPGIARRPDGRLDLWVCTRCGYTYDGDVGETVSRTAPGTPFEDLPDDWRCPHCTAEKEYFFH
jgi:rubredoxin